MSQNLSGEKAGDLWHVGFLKVLKVVPAPIPARGLIQCNARPLPAGQPNPSVTHAHYQALPAGQPNHTISQVIRTQLYPTLIQYGLGSPMRHNEP